MLGLQFANATGGGTLADAAASTSIERAIVLYTSAFSVASVVAPGRMAEAINPSWLSIAVRDVLKYGEHLSVIRVVGGRVRLVPASMWSVEGDADIASWNYSVTLAGPTVTQTERIPSHGVVHLMWSRSKHSPAIGRGPLANCGLSARILGGLVRRLGDRAIQPTGGFLTVPKHDISEDENETNPNDLLGQDVSQAAGRLLIVNTTSGGDGDRASAPARDYVPTSFGLDVKTEASDLMQVVEDRIFASCGIPPGLGGGVTSGQAVSSLYRQFIFNAVQGLAARFSVELEDKLEVSPITFNFSKLGHIAIVERATAIARLIKQAGMSEAEAKATIGL